MVPEDGTREHGAECGDQERGIDRDHDLGGYRQDQTEGAERAPYREGDDTGQDEQDGRQQSECQVSIDHPGQVLANPQQGDDLGCYPRQEQHRGSHQHRPDARQSSPCHLIGGGSLQQQHRPCNGARNEATIEEGDDDVGVRQDLHRGYRSFGASDPDPERQDHGDTDERRHRQNQVTDLAILSRGQVPISLTRDGPVGGIEQGPFLDHAPFMLTHRTEVEPEICNSKNKQDRGNRVVVRRDRRQECFVAGIFVDSVFVQDPCHGGGNEGGPAGDRNQDDDGGGRRVHDVRELGPRNAMRVGDRPTDVSTHQTTESVIEEDDDSQDERDQLGLEACSDPRDRPFGDGLESARYVYEGRQYPQQHNECEDVHLLCYGALGDDQASRYLGDERDAGEDIPLAVHQCTENDPDPQCQQDPPGGNSQADRDD